VRRAILCFPVVAALVAACAGAPSSEKVPTLDQARAREVGTLIDAGQFLPALQEVSYLRQTGGLSTADLDGLEARGLDSLAKAFSAAVSDKKFSDAIRLYGSAATYGKPDLISGWTEASLYDAWIAELDSSGNQLVALMVRLRELELDTPSQAELSDALSRAEKLQDAPMARLLADRMQKLGYALPAGTVVPAASSAIDFPHAIKGTATIWVNRGIKIENGVGYPDRVIGSGFFVDSRGYLLTNYHVVKSEVDPSYEGYSRLYVRLSEESGDRIPAKVVGYDTVFDLALIKADLTPDAIFTGMSTQNPTPGDRVYAIGSPVGLEKTVTAGIVSATGRRFLQVGDTMQVDVPVNPGNSGGPLLNDTGDVVGIVFAGLEQYQGINFAIPAQRIREALPELFAGGGVAHPWLGMALAQTEKGLEITYVLPEGPAAKAGIEVGDMVDTIGGVACTTVEAAQDAVLRYAPESLVRMTFTRGETTQERLLCLTTRPESPVEFALKKGTMDSLVFALFGLQLE